MFIRTRRQHASKFKNCFIQDLHLAIVSYLFVFLIYLSFLLYSETRSVEINGGELLKCKKIQSKFPRYNCIQEFKNYAVDNTFNNRINTLHRIAWMTKIGSGYVSEIKVFCDGF